MREDKRRRKRKKSNASYILEIMLCLIAITAMGLAMLFLIRYHEMQLKVSELQAQVDIYEDPENPYLSKNESDDLIKQEKDAAYQAGRIAGHDEVVAGIKEGLIESDNFFETVKSLYPDELILVDAGEILFFPILDDLKKHPFADEDFEWLDNNRVRYHGSSATTENWIDVSKYQEKINWSSVADDYIDGAIIRVGYRGYSKGDIMDDDTFEKNIKGALKNDLKVGVYFLTQATSDKEAVEEAEYVIEHIKDYNISGPVVLDVERVGGDEARGNLLSIEDRTQYAITFLETVKEAGYDTCIYGNLKTFILMLDMEQLENYSKWFAGYTDYPYFPYEMDMWQYTDTGRVEGISGDVDINIRFVR